MSEREKKAFLLGMMVTREGFNGECPYDHLAPDTIRADRGATEESWMEECKENKAIVKLCGQLEDKLNEA